jgi:hypothetical protein
MKGKMKENDYDEELFGDNFWFQRGQTQGNTVQCRIIMEKGMMGRLKWYRKTIWIYQKDSYHWKYQWM